jgi:hypothetical protein
MLGISRLVKKSLASQEGFYFMESGAWNVVYVTTTHETEEHHEREQ